MPKIREYTSRAEVRGPIETRRASTEDFGSGINNSLARLGQALEGLGEHYSEIDKKSKVRGAVQQASRELQEFSFGLKHGIPNEDGSFQQIDPADHYNEYLKRIDTISSNTKNQLGDGEEFTEFEQEFGAFAHKLSFDVRSNSIGLMKSKNITQIDAGLDGYADQIAEASELSKPELFTKAKQLIESGVSQGLFTPEEGQKKEKNFFRSKDVAEIRRVLRLDPDRAIVDLQVGNLGKNLDPDEQEKWISTAIATSEQKLRKDAAAEDARERKLKRAQDELEENTAKSLWTMHRQGKLSAAEVERLADNLSISEYKGLLNAVSGGNSHTDPIAYTNIRDRIRRGEDSSAIRNDIKKLYVGGRFTREDYDRTLGLLGDSVSGGKASKVERDGIEYINRALTPSSFTKTGFEKILHARVVDDYKAWVDSHPDAGADEARKVYKQYVEDALLIKSDELTISKPRPQFMERGGMPTQDTINQAWQKTKKALEEKKIDQYEFKRQVMLLQEWKNAVKLQELRQQTTTKPQSGSN